MQRKRKYAVSKCALAVADTFLSVLNLILSFLQSMMGAWHGIVVVSGGVILFAAMSPDLETVGQGVLQSIPMKIDRAGLNAVWRPRHRSLLIKFPHVQKVCQILH